MTDRFVTEHVEAGRRDGGVLIQEFFTLEEVQAVHDDFELVFGRSERDGRSAGDGPLDRKRDGEIGAFDKRQFATFEAVPFDCSPALNLIGVHPSLVGLAKQLLDVDSVHLYQCQVWAKFTGDADYDQPFHCDFSNHTLTVPSDDAAQNGVTILCYFTDVSEAHGPAHYVTRPESDEVIGPEGSLTSDRDVAARIQQELLARARSTAAPAGSIFPYGIDVFHRGTNMTVPGGRRYAVMACFKRAGDESIGYHSWAFHHTKPWHRIFDHATPEQLECFGVQPPGDPFWTPTTIERAQVRYPNWDLTPYREAIT